MTKTTRSGTLRLLGLLLGGAAIVTVALVNGGARFAVSGTASMSEAATEADPAAATASDTPTDVDADVTVREYGPSGVVCPSGAVRVVEGGSVQRGLDAAGEGATVCIAEGTYRLTSALRPKPGSTLLFETGAVLNGSREVTNWTSDGQHWVARGQSQSIESSSPPCGANPAACESEDLFRDGQPLVRVLDRSSLRSGTFHFDESADTITVFDDPAGHHMEATVTDTAIEGNGAHDITVRGATIEKFGRHGIVTSDGWLVADNEIRYAHSHGLRAFGATRVEGNYIHHSGNMGIFAFGDGLVFDGNRLAYNNYLNFDLWHAGATKIIRSSNTVVRDNWSHHNTGDGWWFDWDNANATVEGNLFEHNTRHGILYEASFDALIRDNTFRRNGSRPERGGAGVWINTSKNVEVTNNFFDHNEKTLILATADRGVSERYGKRETTGLHAHDNTFVLSQGYVGLRYNDDEIYVDAANNRFDSNDYIVPDVNAGWWRWGAPGDTRLSTYDWDAWTAAGHDTTGTITTP